MNFNRRDGAFQYGRPGQRAICVRVTQIDFLSTIARKAQFHRIDRTANTIRDAQPGCVLRCHLDPSHATRIRQRLPSKRRHRNLLRERGDGARITNLRRL